MISTEEIPYSPPSNNYSNPLATKVFLSERILTNSVVLYLEVKPFIGRPTQKYF